MYALRANIKSIHIRSCNCHMLVIFSIRAPKSPVIRSCKVLQLQKNLQLCYSAILNVWWHYSTIVSYFLIIFLLLLLLSLSLSSVFSFSNGLLLFLNSLFHHFCFLISPSLTLWLALISLILLAPLLAKEYAPIKAWAWLSRRAATGSPWVLQSLSHNGGDVFFGYFLWQDRHGQRLLWFCLRDRRGYDGLRQHVCGFANRI